MRLVYYCQEKKGKLRKYLVNEERNFATFIVHSFDHVYTLMCSTRGVSELILYILGNRVGSGFFVREVRLAKMIYVPPPTSPTRSPAYISCRYWLIQ